MQDISKKISMAPLRGITVATYRRLFSQNFLGVDYAVAPFIPLSSNGTVNVKQLADIMPQVCGSVCTVPQAIGKHPESLVALCNAIKDFGYSELNLNCGCPWKFVAKKGRGSGLPEDEQCFEAMLEAGCGVMGENNFSIKIRLGRNTPETLASRVDLINRYSLKEIIIHPRTGVQMYEGDVLLDEFAKISLSFNMPVVYNGDIYSVEDYIRIKERFPCISGVMLGRGLIIDPFLAEDIKLYEKSGKISEKSVERKRKVFEFANLLYEEYKKELFGPAPVLGRMKELWLYMSQYFTKDSSYLKKIQRSKSLFEYEVAVDLFAEEMGL